MLQEDPILFTLNVIFGFLVAPIILFVITVMFCTALRSLFGKKYEGDFHPPE